MAPKSTDRASVRVKPIRPVDAYFSKYSATYSDSISMLILWVATPILVLGILGLVWCIPFPDLKFLGQYNGFFNWASFLVAFSIYYYYKLSPVLSYFMLLVLFALSYAIIDLQTWQKKGGPALWIPCTVAFVIGLAGLLAAPKAKGKKLSLADTLQFMLIAPIWLLHFMVDKLKLKY